MTTLRQYSQLFTRLYQTSLISCRYCALIFIALYTIGCEATPNDLTLEYKVIASREHDTNLFTQGLELDGEWLIESSGQYKRSLVRKYHSDSGALKWQKKLPDDVFAEGLTQLNNILHILTWKEQILLRFDSESLTPIEPLTYSGQGWGLATDGKMLFMSNGSKNITVRDPNTFNIQRTLTVANGSETFSHLNELEYAKDSLWANIWHQSHILRIDPTTGMVTGIVNLSPLARLHQSLGKEAVLNGIAYDQKRDAFWVTGKYWSKRYLIKLIN